jgi:predicted dienelactone hydrolase
MKNWLYTLSIFLVLCGCSAKKPKQAPFKVDVYFNAILTKIDTVTFIDTVQKRPIPVTIYNRDYMHNMNDMLPKNIKRKLVILNPGYGGTRNDYRYIASNLAINNYMVVVIQHDLPTDDTLPRTGDIYKLRKPF